MDNTTNNENNINNKIEKPLAILMFVNAALFLALTATTMSMCLVEIVKRIFS